MIIETGTDLSPYDIRGACLDTRLVGMQRYGPLLLRGRRMEAQLRQALEDEGGENMSSLGLRAQEGG